MLNLTPRQIVTELDRYVVGQTKAKRLLAITARNFWHLQNSGNRQQMSLLNRNLLLYGPTGSGKTSISSYLAQILGLNFRHIPVTQIVSEGYRGFNISDLVQGISSQSQYVPTMIYQRTLERYPQSVPKDTPISYEPNSHLSPPWMGDLKRGQSACLKSKTLVVLDELDKLIVGDSRQINRREVQQELLALLENPSYTAGSDGLAQNDLSSCMFICAGAFTNMKQVKLLMPELLGRIPQTAEMHSLNKSDFEKILFEAEDSPLTQMYNMLKRDDVHVTVSDSAVNRIARIAYDLNQNGHDLGARRLHQVVQRVFEDIAFRAPELAKQSIHIDDNYFMLSRDLVE